MNPLFFSDFLLGFFLGYYIALPSPSYPPQLPPRVLIYLFCKKKKNFRQKKLQTRRLSSTSSCVYLRMRRSAQEQVRLLYIFLFVFLLKEGRRINVDSFTPKSMGPPTKCIIFDIDGTLVSSGDHCISITNSVLKENGRPPVSIEEYMNACKYDTPTRFAVHLYGEERALNPDNPEFREHGRDLGNEFDERYVRLLDASNCPLFPGIKPQLLALQSTKNMKVSALTNACKAYADSVLEAHDIYKCFDTIEGADSVPESKPSPSGILKILAELSLPPQHCVMVGDSVGDGEAGVRAGCRTLGVGWGANPSAKLMNSGMFTEGVANSVEEMWKLLLQNK